MHELTLALRRLKSSKAPGPDGLVVELYKHAPYTLRMYLLDHYNLCLSTAAVPSGWLFSEEMVMIVKNYSEDTRLLSNYCPISKANNSYKMFASMLQSRLSHHLDDRIRHTQYDFRKIDLPLNLYTYYDVCLQLMKDRLLHSMHYSLIVPHHSDVHNEYFRIPNTQKVLSVHSTHSVVWMDNTLLYRKIRVSAQSKPYWQTILHKPSKPNST